MRLVVIGAGGHGRVVADAALSLERYTSVSFVDDSATGMVLPGCSVIGQVAHLFSGAISVDACVVGIGNNATRLKLHRAAEEAGIALLSVVHPRAVVSRFATIGPGCVVFANAVINAGAQIGPACIVNTAATVDHDCVLEGGVHIAPGAHLSGGVRVGAQSWIGVGASVRHGLTIGSGAMVGAGASVVATVPDNTTVVGVPAKPLSRAQGNNLC